MRNKKTIVLLIIVITLLVINLVILRKNVVTSKDYKKEERITNEELVNLINSYGVWSFKKELMEVEASEGREVEIVDMEIMIPDGWEESTKKQLESREFTKTINETKYSIRITYDKKTVFEQRDIYEGNFYIKDLLYTMALDVDGRVILVNVNQSLKNKLDIYVWEMNMIYLVTDTFVDSRGLGIKAISNFIPSQNSEGSYKLEFSFFPLSGTGQAKLNQDLVREFIGILKSINWAE
jgi:hypothetical protein